MRANQEVAVGGVNKMATVQVAILGMSSVLLQSQKGLTHGSCSVFLHLDIINFIFELVLYN